MRIMIHVDMEKEMEKFIDLGLGFDLSDYQEMSLSSLQNIIVLKEEREEAFRIKKIRATIIEALKVNSTKIFKNWADEWLSGKNRETSKAWEVAREIQRKNKNAKHLHAKNRAARFAAYAAASLNLKESLTCCCDSKDGVDDYMRYKKVKV